MKSFVVAILTLGMIFFGHAKMEAQKSSKEQQYFMDVHKMEANGFTYADVAGAHVARRSGNWQPVGVREVVTCR